MKKIALFTVMVTLGLQGLKADPSMSKSGTTLPPGYTSVHMNLVLLEQGAEKVKKSGSTNSTIAKVYIDDDDIFGLINDEFSTNFSILNGDQLVVSNFWDGTFSVLDSTGSVLLANASVNTNGDHYRLYFFSTNIVFSTEQAASGEEQKFSVADSYFRYRSGNGTNVFHLEGIANVDDHYIKGTNSTESFDLSDGAGRLYFPDAGMSGVLSGSIRGSGKDSAPTP